MSEEAEDARGAIVAEVDPLTTERLRGDNRCRKPNPRIRGLIAGQRLSDDLGERSLGRTCDRHRCRPH